LIVFVLTWHHLPDPTVPGVVSFPERSGISPSSFEALAVNLPGAGCELVQS